MRKLVPSANLPVKIEVLGSSETVDTSTEPHGFVSRNTVYFKYTAVTAIRLTFVLISYRSGDYKDELVWGAVWLYRATNDNSYLTTAEQLYNEFGLQNWNGGFTWDSKISGVEVR
jgi:uncharacterized protein YyaL (SSP411 family)